MNTAIIQLPGTCDDRDARDVAQRLGSARLVHWNERTDWSSALEAFDLVILPGGFSYGDYLRPGALASKLPVIKEVRRYADGGGLVLGICNGFQILCEAGLLPGALRVNRTLRFICRDVLLEVPTSGTVFTQAYAPGECISLPIKHGFGRYYASRQEIRRLKDRGQVLFTYADKDNPNGSSARIAGICNEARTVAGLMPHPEHAVDSLVGAGSDGLRLFESICSHVALSDRASGQIAA